LKYNKAKVNNSPQKGPALLPPGCPSSEVEMELYFVASLVLSQLIYGFTSCEGLGSEHY
jgi:hypothetical protein